MDETTPAPFSSWTGEIPPWRFLVMGAIASAAYAVLPLWVSTAQFDPLLLAAVLTCGAIVGMLLGRRDGTRTPRRVPVTAAAGAGAILAGLSGAGLILAQVVSDGVAILLPLGLAGWFVAGATGAWVRDRTGATDARAG